MRYILILLSTMLLARAQVPEPPVIELPVPTYVTPPIHIPYLPDEYTPQEFLDYLRLNNPDGYQQYLDSNPAMSSVPEPAAYGLIAGALVLAIAYRKSPNKLR